MTTPSSTWQAVMNKRGWPTAIKTFRTKRDAHHWVRRTEDEIVRGVYIDPASSDQLLLRRALEREPICRIFCQRDRSIATRQMAANWTEPDSFAKFMEFGALTQRTRPDFRRMPS